MSSGHHDDIMLYQTTHYKVASGHIYDDLMLFNVTGKLERIMSVPIRTTDHRCKNVFYVFYKI